MLPNEFQAYVRFHRRGDVESSTSIFPGERVPRASMNRSEAPAEVCAPAGVHADVGFALDGLHRSDLRSLRFPVALEVRFEEETRNDRAHRLWFEGLIAIVVFNICLLFDYLFVGDATWQTLVWRTSIATPLSLIVNILMRFNPPKWLREGSIATVMVAICFINLFVQGTSTAAHTLFGSVGMFITALFVGVVMRLRFPYMATAICIMLLGGVCFLTRSESLSMSEVVVATSMMIMTMGIILIASYSMEREERRSYVLCLKSDLQAEALAEANAELQHLSSLDNLTGLPNRRALEDRFSQLWFECAITGKPLAVIVADIDHFKKINDVFGHVYGDEALRRVAGLLPKALRSPGDMVARFGGEEFVLLLPNATQEVALTVAERVRTLIETAGTPTTSHAAGDATMWATISCGVSVCIPNEDLTTTQLLEAADRALYMAKNDGRNCVRYCECEPMEAVPEYQSPYLVHAGAVPRGSENGIRAAAGS